MMTLVRPAAPKRFLKGAPFSTIEMLKPWPLLVDGRLLGGDRGFDAV
jgi:hypothetical protein